MQQEAMASKMKQENEAIRNEAETDLSTFYLFKLSKISLCEISIFYVCSVCNCAHL